MEHAHGPSYPGTVVLELGDGAGALIVHTGPEALGQEIEITGPGLRTHAEVRERRLPGGDIYCAVYSGIPAGEYTVRSTLVIIEAGRVTELRAHR